jgi:hypothetical protein
MQLQATHIFTYFSGLVERVAERKHGNAYTERGHAVKPALHYTTLTFKSHLLKTVTHLLRLAERDFRVLLSHVTPSENAVSC